MDAKPIKQWTNVNEPGDFNPPFNLILDGVKLELLWDEENEKEVLKLDKTLYSDLPFISEEFRLDDKDLP